MVEERAANEWRWWAAGASLVVVVVSIIPALAAHPRLNFDSGNYLSDPSFDSGRLLVVPGFYMLTGHTWRLISAGQALLGAFCWCFLLTEVARCPRRVVRFFALSAVVVIACSTYVVQWYAAILSDSISISLLVLIVALVARWQRLRCSLWPLAVVCVLWAMTRPTNAYTLAIAVVMLMPVVLVKYRKALPQLACVLVASLVAIYLAGRGQLWKQPFIHSMAERILIDPSLRAWFAHHGMPLTPALRRATGGLTQSTATAFVQSPGLHTFRIWMNHSGKSTFAEFLFAHIPWVLRGTFGRHEELDPGLMSFYGGGVARAWYPTSIRNVFMAHRQLELTILVGAGLLAAAVRAARRTLGSARDAALVWGAVLVLGLVTLAIDWAGDSWEVGRHSVDGTIIVALAGIMLLSCLTSTMPRPHVVDTVDTTRDDDLERQRERAEALKA